MNILYVAGSVPEYLKGNNSGNSVYCVVPKYSKISENIGCGMKYVMHFYINLSWRIQYCGVFRKDTEWATLLFIDNELYFGKNSTADAYGLERYTFFSRAVLEMLPKIGLKPELINICSWEGALVPVMLKEYAAVPYYSGIETNIHTAEGIVG